MAFTAEMTPTALVNRIGQFKDLMPEEGDQGEEDEGETQLLLAMTKIMFQMISLVLERVKTFVFDFPAGATGADQEDDAIPGNEAIGDPTIGIMDDLVAMVVNGDDPIAQKIGKERVLGAVERDVIEPFINMGAPLFVLRAPGLELIGASGNRRHQGFV